MWTILNVGKALTAILVIAIAGCNGAKQDTPKIAIPDNMTETAAAVAQSVKPVVECEVQENGIADYSCKLILSYLKDSSVGPSTPLLHHYASGNEPIITLNLEEAVPSMLRSFGVVGETSNDYAQWTWETPGDAEDGTAIHLLIKKYPINGHPGFFVNSSKAGYDHFTQSLQIFEIREGQFVEHFKRSTRDSSDDRLRFTDTGLELDLHDNAEDDEIGTYSYDWSLVEGQAVLNKTRLGDK